VLSARQSRLIGWLLPVALAAGGAALDWSGALDRLENESLDWRFRLRGTWEPRQDIVIVEMDRASRGALSAGDRMFQLRRFLPAAIKNLSRAGAAVIGLDVILEGEGDPATDALVAQAIADAAAPVVLAVAHTDGGVKRPAARFREAGADEGVINVSEDADGVLRRLPPTLHLTVPEPDGTLVQVPHFPLVVAWYAVPEDQAGETVRLDADGAWVGPHRLRAGEWVDFHATRESGWVRLPLADVVNGSFDPAWVKDAVVLVGESRSIADTFTLPLGGTLTPGVYYHASVIAQILDDRHLWSVPANPWSRAGLVGGLGLVAGWFAWNPRRWWELRHGTAILATYVTVGVLVFLGGWTLLSVAAFRRAVVLPLAGPLLVMALTMAAGLAVQWVVMSANARRLAERARRIETLFGQSVSHNVLDALKADPGSILETHVRDVTVLFCDIRGYTAASAALSPLEIAGMLNEYFTDVSDAIFEHDGFIDKFVGDEVMAVFSVPLEQPDHVARAVRTGVAIKQRVQRLNERRAARGEAPLACGIGIHTGPAAAGHIGSARRSNYTVVGDTVNLAARIQQVARRGELLISRAVCDRLPEGVQAVPWDTMELRGSAAAHELFEIAVPEGLVPPERMRVITYRANGSGV